MYDATMTARRTTRGSILLLGLAACQPSAADDPSAQTQPLQAIDERLAAIETKLESIETKLDGNASQREARRDESRRGPTLDSEGGRRPPLPLPPGPSPFDAEGIRCEGFETPNIDCKIDRSVMTSLLDSPDLLARQARVVPSVRDGEPRGYKLYGLRPGSLPKLVGMKNGDTITSMAGKPLDSMDAAMDVYAGLREGKQLVIGLERGNSPIVLTLDIVD
jgi:hypothetical protein